MAVVFDHDGSVDDLAALALLAMGEPHLAAVYVTDGDCYARPAAIASKRLLTVCDRGEVPVYINTSALESPFPACWREDSLRINEIPPLRSVAEAKIESLDGESALLQQLETDSDNVSLISTSPLSATAAALRRRPGLARKLRSVLWMGGSFSEMGNVEEAGHDGSAEWNSYADPSAVSYVISSGVDFTLCPLEVCHKVPVDRKFVDTLAARREHRVYDVLSSIYGLVAYRRYHAWDLLTAAYHLAPEIFSTHCTRIDIQVSGASKGKTARQETSPVSATVVDDVDLTAFFELLHGTWMD